MIEIGRLIHRGFRFFLLFVLVLVLVPRPRSGKRKDRGRERRTKDEGQMGILLTPQLYTPQASHDRIGRLIHRGIGRFSSSSSSSSLVLVPEREKIEDENDGRRTRTNGDAAGITPLFRERVGPLEVATKRQVQIHPFAQARGAYPRQFDFRRQVFTGETQGGKRVDQSLLELLTG